MLNTHFTPDELNIFKQMCHVISKWDVYKGAAVVNEILMFHRILAWDINTKCLTAVGSVSINGRSIQLNLEEYENDETE